MTAAGRAIRARSHPWAIAAMFAWQAGFALLAANIYRDDLKDYGRALVELRRILARYPEVPNAARLRAEIEELKTIHFEAP